MIKKYPAPHIRKEMNISLIYLHVLLALLPCAAAAVYYYGIRALLMLFAGMGSYAASDYLFIRFVRHEKYVWDASALVSGAILTLILPPTVPVWILLTGVLFASVIVKQCFGGLGCTLFNPALAARAFLTLAFPFWVSAYTEPLTGIWTVKTLLFGPVDAISSATPGSGGNALLFELFSGRYPGAIGETCAFSIIIGGLYLFSQGILRMQAPLAYLAVMLAGYWAAAGGNGTISGMLYSILTGGVLFCAAFTLGDYATTPTTSSGKVMFGAGTALLTLLIRQYGNTAFAVGFAVLAMNAVTPILDFYIRPRIYSMPSWFSGGKKTAGLLLKGDKRV